MKLSTRARYALRMLIEIARLGDGQSAVNLTRVAEETSLSRRYLEQLAIALKSASLLRGVSGRFGGYVLGRPPEEICVRDVIEASIGPVSVVDCVRDPEACDRSDGCECRWVYAVINERIVDVLNDITLADLLRRDRPFDA